MSVAIHPLPNTPSWRGAELKRKVAYGSANEECERTKTYTLGCSPSVELNKSKIIISVTKG
jgi:hypothetical protein